MKKPGSNAKNVREYRRLLAVELFESGMKQVDMAKTKDGGMKHAWLPMTEMLCEALREHRRRHCETPLVFSQRTGRGAYTSRQHLMPQLCARAGVKPFGFHAIRHLAATLLAYAGLDLPTVQAMLRHSSSTTTARYIKRLGIEKENIEAPFGHDKRAKVTPFAPSKKTICT